MADDREVVLKAIDSAFDAQVAELFKTFVFGVIDTTAKNVENTEPLKRFARGLEIYRRARLDAIRIVG